MTLPAVDPLDNVGRGSDLLTVFTVRNLVDSYLAHARHQVQAGNLEPMTVRWYVDQFRHLEPVANFPAAELRAHHLISVDLTNAIARSLKTLYRWAALEELVDRNPFARLAVPQCGQRERVLERAEVARLYRAALDAAIAPDGSTPHDRPARRDPRIDVGTSRPVYAG